MCLNPILIACSIVNRTKALVRRPNEANLAPMLMSPDLNLLLSAMVLLPLSLMDRMVTQAKSPHHSDQCSPREFVKLLL